MTTTRVNLHHPHASALRLRGDRFDGWQRSVAPVQTGGSVAAFEFDAWPGEPVQVKPIEGDRWALGGNVPLRGGDTVELYPTFAQGSGRVTPLFTGFFSQRLQNHRDVHVYLPPGYDENPEKRYPVVYVNDGQNVFDALRGEQGSWHLDKTLDDLIGRGLIPPVLCVAIPAHDARMSEYTAVPDARHGGGNADAYLDFVFDELKTQVDRTLRTYPEASNTSFIGSSLGGHVALYAGHTRKHQVSRIGALSPTTESWADNWLAREVESGRQNPQGLWKLWVDNGDTGSAADDDPARLLRAYREGGLREGEGCLQSWVDPDAGHNEQAWAYRVGRVLQHLLR